MQRDILQAITCSTAFFPSFPELNFKDRVCRPPSQSMLDILSQPSLDARKRASESVGQTSKADQGQTSGQNHLKAPTSPYKGVSWNKMAHKWVVHIGMNGVQRHLGCFTEEKEAAKAYDMAVFYLRGR
jgi:hypothetical protein